MNDNLIVACSECDRELQPICSYLPTHTRYLDLPRYGDIIIRELETRGVSYKVAFKPHTPHLDKNASLLGARGAV